MKSCSLPQSMRVLGLSVVVAVASGCAVQANTIPSEPMTPQYTIQEPIDSLEKISIEIRDEVRLLAKIRQEERERQMTPSEKGKRALATTQIPSGFEVTISELKLTDDLDKAIQLVAMQAGYAVKFTHPELRHDYPISLNLKNQVLFDALMDIGAQTDDAVEINVYPSKKLMVVEYRDRI